MARLPIPGDDAGYWGAILNEYLSVEHNTDGSLKKAAQIMQAVNDVAQAKSDVDSVVASVNSAVASVEGKLGDDLLGVANGIATLDENNMVSQTIDAGKVTSGTLDAERIPDLSASYMPIDQALQLETYDGSVQSYKLLVTSTGAVQAVPASATYPNPPDNLSLDIHLSFLTLSWDSVDGAAQYLIYRDSTYLASATSTSYLDDSISISSTYSYTVIAVNYYGMWSQSSSAAQAYIDPALNTAPSIGSITIWPTSPRPNEKVYVHVNSSDIDIQELETVLQVTAGSLQATYDPTTWIWQGA